MPLKDKITTELIELENTINLLAHINKNEDNTPQHINTALSIKVLADQSINKIQELFAILEKE